MKNDNLGLLDRFIKDFKVSEPFRWISSHPTGHGLKVLKKLVLVASFKDSLIIGSLSSVSCLKL